MMKPVDGRKRVVIEGVDPEIDAGRFPIKRIIGDTVHVEANVFGDGHDRIACHLLFRHEGETQLHRVKMEPLGNDRWRAAFQVNKLGEFFYTIAGSVDHFGTWRSDLIKRLEAAQDVALELQTGAMLIEQAALRAVDEDAIRLKEWAYILRVKSGDEETKQTALDAELTATMQRYANTDFETRYDRELSVVVDRERARFSSWYEMFPRSCSPALGKHGTFQDTEVRLEYVAGMGFDVLYLPPIHPIGSSFRKGKNNSVSAQPGDVGSPWAIGSQAGGHTAIHPELGTLPDFELFIAKAKSFGLEIAMDIAFQCSPDHPWVKEHPLWFKHRADGSIRYAENPPKKYQDIYPLDFESEDWAGLWDALKDVFIFWIEHGVRIFRVDNPHTKAFPFWEWAIGEIKREHKDVLFLAEAFTRPRVMERLAKLGFSQSYTYFTWRNTKQELTEYLNHLFNAEVKEYFRPNFWPNTPDILPEQLQMGGRAAFMSRLVLAATLGTNYGVYGPAFELLENLPVKRGGEEYLNSEKYELKHWNLDDQKSLAPLIRDLNRARHENAALQTNHELSFHATDNPYLICYSKRSADGSNVVLIVVSLDPVHVQAGWVDLDLVKLGVDAHEPFQIHDQLADERYLWQGPRNYVELSPFEIPAHVFRVMRRIRTEKDFDYYL
ncbi:alpha-1,4-glucan--maltose-1-phosphate maltosyltransferase [Alloacidobacterium sp.]|uniref:alpha-1,4-glucan--maltose-1-phosphate maltosyltransferase n=1 Tax=Alloacidobacterium sp. TaxID=2951999 RepID=UPI002D4EF149|nr:alpha-1,4-glucan--maltose-1-phosphate maltosyltransferase [Alloacidobacterium sp.]HYK35729.1 alpha-1,4-glucan--maltose-1-phosphate maltosyltransferase [Alloacidobacterium sp.]